MFKPMRSCEPSDKYPLRFPLWVSPKLDGIRMAKFENADRTKSGKPVPNRTLSAWIRENLPDGLDTEMLAGNPTDPACYTKTFSATMSHEGDWSDVKFYVFDMCNDLTTQAAARMENVRRLVAAAPETVRSRIVIVPQEVVYSEEQFYAKYSEYLEQGYEGLIAKDPYQTYKYGKSTPKEQTQLKIKPNSDDEAPVTGAYEAEENQNETFTNEVGETRRSTHQENKVGKAMLGGFNVVFNGIDCKIAPGKLSHAERITLWQEWLTSPETFCKRIVKFRHLGYGTMTNGRPRHPRWIGWRHPVDMEPAV